MENNLNNYLVWGPDVVCISGRDEHLFFNVKQSDGLVMPSGSSRYFLDNIDGMSTVADLVSQLLEANVLSNESSSDNQDFFSVLESLLDLEILCYTRIPSTSECVRKPSVYRDQRYQNIEKLQVELTNICNFKCIHCMASASTAVGNAIHLHTKTILKRIDELSGHGYLKDVCLTGGEPFLHPDIERIIKELSDIVNVHVITNGSLIQFSEKQHLLHLLSSIRISLYGCNEKEYYLFTGKRSVYRSIIDNISWLSNMFPDKLSVIIPTTITNEALNHRIELVKKMNLKYEISFCAPIGRARENWISLESHKNHALGDFDKYMSNVLNIDEDYIFKRIQCRCNTAAISYSGDISFCPSLMTKEFIYGNILNESIPHNYSDAGWIQKILKYSVDNKERCSSCIERYFCGGGCLALTYHMTGSLSKIYPYCMQQT